MAGPFLYAIGARRPSRRSLVICLVALMAVLAGCGGTGGGDADGGGTGGETTAGPVPATTPARPGRPPQATVLPPSGLHTCRPTPPT